MEENKQHFLENLLNDSSFKNWVFKSNRNDVAFWNNWINNNPDYIDTIYSAKDIIKGISFNKKELSPDFINNKFDLVFNQIHSNTLERSKKNKETSRPNTTLIGSGVLVAFSLIILFFGINSLNFNEDVVHKTGFGEIINLKLPDGTTVVLNGNSKLEYKADNPRNVTLNGEAYFKVMSKPSTKAKFWVTTEDLKVEVFGTHFNVNTREEKTNVLLDEGSISLLLDNGISKKMNPGEIVSYSKVNETILHEKINSDYNYALWRDGTYIFNNVSLKEVMKYIEHAYGISSQFIDDKTKEIKLTGGIPNENLKICIDAIQKSTGISIIEKDNKLLITNN